MYAVYRHFDENDRLLYVGRSRDPLRRMKQHRTHAKWFKEITKLTIEQFGNFEEAAKAEVDAIKAEKPVYNVHHARAKVETRKPRRPSRKDLKRRQFEELQLEAAAIIGLGRTLPDPECSEFMNSNFERWRADNSDLWQKALADAKNFAGYQTPNDDDVIEANSEE